MSVKPSNLSSFIFPSLLRAHPAPSAAPTLAPARKGLEPRSLFQSAPGTRASGSAAVAAQPRAKATPTELPVRIEDQGNTNGCGTTSLAAVLSYWGQPTTRTQVDQEIRKVDSFTSPDDLLSYARSHGMRAELKNDASLNDLARMVDRGVPPMVLVDPDSPNNFNLHYMVVAGYARDASGKVSSVVLADPATGQHRTMKAADFDKQWGNLHMAGVPSGLSRVMITAVPNDGRAIRGPDGVSRKASAISLPTSSFWSSLKAAPARGITSLISSVTNTAATVWSGLKTAGRAVADAGKAVVKWFKSLW